MYERLSELTEAAPIARHGRDHTLTPLGRSLGSALEPLDGWSVRWAQHLRRR
jgi:DNA-binding HxlR family transcriptional regulator